MVVALQNGFDLMGKRPMADVMEKGESLKKTRFICGKPLDSAESLCESEHADGMFKTRMDGSRKYQIIDSQLFAAAKTLEVRMFHDG